MYKKWKKRLFVVVVFVCFSAGASKAQFIITEVLQMTVGKVIKAIDLKVQRMQNKTIALQNAQKMVENELSRYRLQEIAGSTGKQQNLFSSYYQSLRQVKSAVNYIGRIREAVRIQHSTISAYRSAFATFSASGKFKPQELIYLQSVYSGILRESGRNLDAIVHLLTGDDLQMSDAARLSLIDAAMGRLTATYNDLMRFNRQSAALIANRKKEEIDNHLILNYYGIR